MRKNKYSAVRTLYDGEWYDSKKEARYAAQLNLLKHAMYTKDRVVKVERQPVFVLVKAHTPVIPSQEGTYERRGENKSNRAMTYRADFRVTYADGRVEVVDVKGVLTPVFKLKLKLMKAVYPEIVIRLV